MESTNSCFVSSEQESNYWSSSTLYARRLSCADGRSNVEAATPLVMSYVPTFTPGHSRSGSVDSISDDSDEDITISPETFCKWHWMVFPGTDHPTPAQSRILLKSYSSRDLQEIARIARLASNEQVFVRGGLDAFDVRYQAMWDQWLESKGPDYVVVFA